jgi:hypothetical protein
MAENLLVSDQLTPEMISFGEQLVEKLGKSDLPIKGAFWMLLPESKLWRLVVASPEVGTLGPMSVYKKIQATLKKMGSDGPLVDLGDISVIEDTEQPFKSFKKILRASQGGKGNRISRSVINGQLIDDAFIYRLPKLQPD